MMALTALRGPGGGSCQRRLEPLHIEPLHIALF
jgi:hypothetical protein